MKRRLQLVLVLLLLFSFSKVYAACNDSELNAFANGLKIEYKEYSKYGFTDDKGEKVWTGELPYSYLLAFSDTRDDIYAKASTNFDNEVIDGRMIPGYNIYAIGCQNNLTEIVYTVKVFASSNSACPNELLKTVNVKVPPFNMYSLTDLCDSNPTHELCAAHKDTSGVTADEFIKQVKVDDKKPIKEDNKLLRYILGTLCIVIPAAAIIIYLERDHKKGKKK